ncbi:MAG: RluA family pseudouridine synthase [Treponema sp.]|nr:RluA family pseudouridine synthase [Treponema sp.]
MDFTNYTAGLNDSGRRLDKILKHIFQDSQKTNIYAALRKKLIKVNGSKSAADYILKEGDVISIAKFLLQQDAEAKNNEMQDEHKDFNFQFQTIFKNQHIWIINKPYGINVHSSQSKEIDIASIIAMQCKDNSSIAFTPAPLHRLDKYTTGILSISQSHEGAVWFSKAISDHAIKKTYIGIAEGTLKEKKTWEDSIENMPSNKKSFHTVTISEGAKKSITHAAPLAYGAYKGLPVTLIQYSIETGRKHQIRIQSSSHGFPLLGDSAYNSHNPVIIPKQHAFFLHAIQISFPTDNPLSMPKTVTAPLPKEFEDFLQFSLIKWNKKLII